MAETICAVPHRKTFRELQNVPEVPDMKASISRLTQVCLVPAFQLGPYKYPKCELKTAKDARRRQMTSNHLIYWNKTVYTDEIKPCFTYHNISNHSRKHIAHRLETANAKNQQQLWVLIALVFTTIGFIQGPANRFFFRSNRISNRIGRPIRFRIESSNRIGRIPCKP